MKSEQSAFEKAVTTLLEAVMVGQSKGAYSLKEAAHINAAVELITTPPAKPEEVSPEVKE